jgi:hypothetical protein
MDLAPFLGIGEPPERVLELLIRLILVFMSCSIDLTIFLLLFGPLAFVVKELSSCFWDFDAFVSYRRHGFGLLYVYLLYSLEISYTIVEGIDDHNILNVQDDIPGVEEVLDEVIEAFIGLLLDDLKGLCCDWPLVCPLEISNEQSTGLVPWLDHDIKQVDEPWLDRSRQHHVQVVGFDLVVATSYLDDRVVHLDELCWVDRAIILVDHTKFKLVY